MVGREVLLEVDEAAGAARASRCSRCEDLHVVDDRELRGRARRLASRCGPARSSASPASTATARPSWSRRSPACATPTSPARSRSTGRDIRAPRRASATDARRRATSPRTATGTAWCSTSPGREQRPARLRPAAGRRRPACSTSTRDGERARRRTSTRYDVRGGGPEHAGALAVRRQPAEVHPGREIDADPRLLLASQPTRGLDVGAIEFVHRRLVEQRDAGRAILLVSFELDEVLSLADRILVHLRGADRARARRRHDRRAASSAWR